MRDHQVLEEYICLRGTWPTTGLGIQSLGFGAPAIFKRVTFFSPELTVDPMCRKPLINPKP